MKETRNIMAIRARKRDVVLNKWWRAVKDEEEGLLSILIREAVLHYIRTKSFKDIGHIYVSKEDEALSQTHSINVWIGGCEEIKDWISGLDKNCNLAQLLREILRRSITLVSSPTEEWIPGYLEMEEGVQWQSFTVPEKVLTVKQESTKQDELRDNKKEEEVFEKQEKIEQPVMVKQELSKQDESRNDVIEEVSKKQEKIEEDKTKRERKSRRAMALMGSRRKV